MLIGLEKCSPGFIDEALIFHDGLSEYDKACLQKIRRCDFMEYAPQSLSGLADNEAVNRFSLLSFARYELFNLLETSEYVLYLDADVAVLQDVRDILQYVPIGMKTGGFPLNTSLGPNDYDLDDAVLGHNSGVIIAHDSLPYGGLTSQCYELTVKHWDTLRFPDQGVINLVLHLNNIVVAQFPKIYNAHLNEFLYNRRIVHQPTHAKF